MHSVIHEKKGNGNAECHGKLDGMRLSVVIFVTQESHVPANQVAARSEGLIIPAWNGNDVRDEEEKGTHGERPHAGKNKFDSV